MDTVYKSDENLDIIKQNQDVNTTKWQTDLAFYSDKKLLNHLKLLIYQK